MESILGILRECCLVEATNLPTKKERPYFSILGRNNGTWKLIAGYDIGWTRVWDWHIAAAMSSRNSWKTLMVDHATEQHAGLLQALREAVTKYPGLLDYVIAFDGPFMPLKDLLGRDLEYDWSKMTFYHGTSDAVWQAVKREGLKPRADTGSKPAYGSLVGAKLGRSDGVYLTTQLNTALFAARDAARNTGSIPRVLIIKGIDASKVAPDEDSRESTAIGSLRKLGSIVYVGTIPPKLIKLRS